MKIIDVKLPTLHSGQVEVFKQRAQLNVVRCGRRWGKTRLLETIASDAANKGKSVGLFAPEYKQLFEPWEHIREYLSPVVAYTNKMVSLKTRSKGKIDFWRLNDNELAGRGFEYDLVLIDEAAFTKTPQMLDIWQKSIKPTMLTTRGKAWVFSTPNGVDPDNFFYKINHDPEMGFTSFHAPTSTNPYVPLDELEKEKKLNHPLVFQQEYLAEFIDWSGSAFFAGDKMLVNGKPVEYPSKCDGVFAVMDTAVKGGKENDGTAIVYCAINRFVGHPLVILDWDIVQIYGAMLENYLPSVFNRLETLANATNARNGVVGTFIEDAAAGSILIQQGRIRGWNTHAIDSGLTSAGKDERAISVSGYYHQEKIKISQYAYDKTVNFKGATRNHLLTQIAGFRIGDKEAYKRADDLLDAFVYSLAIGVGDKYGY